MTEATLPGQLASLTTPAPPAYRWVVLLLCWLAITITFTDRLAWPTIALQAGQSLGLPVAALGVFVTAFYAGYVLSNVLGGLSTDRFGSEIIVLCSLAPLGVATAAFGFTTRIGYGLTLQLLMGLAAGANYSATVKLIVSWFGAAERGRAMGLLTSANSFGLVVANAIVPSLSAATSWHMAYHVLGLLTVSFGILAFVLLRRREAPGRALRSDRIDPFVVFRSRNLRLLALAGFGAMWGTWGIAVWANALMTKRFAMSATQAGALIALFGIAGMVSKPAIGLLLDFLGASRKKSLAALVLALFAAVLVGYSALTTTAFLVPATLLLGFTAFVYTPLLVALVSESAEFRSAGTAVGITNAFWQLGSVIVPAAIGVIYAGTGSFHAALLALAAGPALAAATLLLVHPSGESR